MGWSTVLILSSPSVRIPWFNDDINCVRFPHSKLFINETELFWLMQDEDKSIIEI
jgi:hypothetical protein